MHYRSCVYEHCIRILSFSSRSARDSAGTQPGLTGANQARAQTLAFISLLKLDPRRTVVHHMTTMSQNQELSYPGRPDLRRTPSVHTHTPELLRAAIMSISAATDSDHIGRAAQSNVVVSHPPRSVTLHYSHVFGAWLARVDPNARVCHGYSPRSVPANIVSEADNLASLYRPLNDIKPLDLGTLRRIPLSTPPRSPSSATDAAQDCSDDRLKSSSLDEAENVYPLILVTGRWSKLVVACVSLC